VDPNEASRSYFLILNRQEAGADACVLQHYHRAFLQRFLHARDVGYEQLYLCGRAALARAPEWLADNPFYTKRFAFFVGRRCRVATIKDVANELHLDWDSVKTLEKRYMREQLRRVATPAPSAIGIDEISIRGALCSIGILW